jgi:RimJ/RimL family protein N-acetyltransferase
VGFLFESTAEQGGMTMIEGTHVNIRAREPEDADTIWRWLNDREVQWFMGNRYPWSLAAEHEWMRDRTKQPPRFEDQSFCIETKDGRLIGTLGLHEITPENRSGSMGIMIGEKDCWSQGYGADAVLSLLRFGFAEMNLHRVQLEVYADNLRAIACYKKCGFVEEVRLRQYRYRAGEWVDALTMGVLRHEFDALHGLTASSAAV